MTDEERLRHLLRTAVQRTAVPGPSRDLWPLIVSRSEARSAWSWLDLSLAAAVAIALLLSPGWLWLLAYHL